MGPIIRDIADTARWVAVFRAEESERSDAVFRDPYARLLAGDRGQQIASAIEFSRANSWSFVARTYLFDAAIERHIAEGFETILNLGAGLDTRPYRMALPSSLNWIEADLPATIAYKDAMLASERPACRLDRICVDLADGEARLALFERVCDSAWNVLVVTEGLIAYLTERKWARSPSICRVSRHSDAGRSTWRRPGCWRWRGRRWDRSWMLAARR
jgi:methyltransferase (TIGR00027 family)